MNKLESRPMKAACRWLPLLAAVLLASACAAPVKYLPLTLTETPEVVVHPFSTKTAGEEYKGETDFGQTLAEYVAGALQANGIRAQVVPEDHDNRGARFIVDGDITQIHPGSAPPHSWSLFGTDRAIFAASYRMSDAEAADADYAGSAEGHASGNDDREVLLKRSAASVADDLADAIRHDLRSAKKHKK